MTPDDDDVSAMWREHHAIRQRKRTVNREVSPVLLNAANIKFIAFTDAHLRVADVYDFWPGTGLWMHMTTKKRGRGVRGLITAIKKGEPA